MTDLIGVWSNDVTSFEEQWRRGQSGNRERERERERREREVKRRIKRRRRRKTRRRGGRERERESVGRKRRDANEGDESHSSKDGAGNAEVKRMEHYV